MKEIIYSRKILTEKDKNALQHRIKLIAGFLPIYESPNGLSWLVFYLLN